MFETLDISMVLGPRRELWVSTLSRHGSVHGVPRVGGNVPSVDELVEITQDFEDGSQYARPMRGVDVGTALREVIFGEPEIKSLFHRTRGAAADQGRQLLVRVLAAPSALAAVPWELTLDPEDGPHQYLTLAPDAHVVRAARSRIYPVRLATVEPPLNVLLILSSPVLSTQDDSSMVFDLFEEKRNLLQELEPLVATDLLRIDVEEHPTLENIRRRIGSRRGGYHIIHYLGHAGPKGLFLEDRAGHSQLAPTETVTELLRLCPQLRLTLFAGCETARPPAVPDGPSNLPAQEWRSGLSTADQCVRESCPTVIGMRAVLPFRTEWLFARFFYQGVASGYSIVDSVRLARAAVRGDEFVGGELLDWAVPSLIVGSDQLGPLIEPAKSPQRRPKTQRVELKFNMIEEDREFFSRLAPLRRAVDVLGGTGVERLLVVTGSAGVGKTALVDRALEDLAERNDCVLYFKVNRLFDSQDPLHQFATWVAELLTKLDHRERSPRPEWDGKAWWERLIGDVTAAKFVIVIDDLQMLLDSPDPKVTAAVQEVITHIAERRGGARVALVASQLPDGFVEARDEHVATLHLMPFTWDEVWVWIRRNLPVLTRFRKAGLDAYYTRLGNNLAGWRELAARVSRLRGEIDLAALADEIAGRRQPAAEYAAPPAAAPTVAPRAQRALRIAIAGPHIKSQEAFAVALTRFAAKNGVGGRILAAGSSGPSSLAELLPITTPFDANGSTCGQELLRWLGTAVQLSPDIVLLDYGGETEAKSEKSVIAKLAEHALVIAAAGHDGPNHKVKFPARMPEVLAVGSSESGNRVWRHSSNDPGSGKPELHADSDLMDTPLAAALRLPNAVGTSFSALRVVAAAALVWSVCPSRDHHWVRAQLLNSSTALKGHRKKVAGRLLDISGALLAARCTLIRDSLKSGLLTFDELEGSTGLSSRVLKHAVDTLLDRDEVRIHEEAGTMHYELVGTAT